MCGISMVVLRITKNISNLEKRRDYNQVKNYKPFHSLLGSSKLYCRKYMQNELVL